MADFIFLMHADSPDDSTTADWERYIERLSRKGHFGGGSAIGAGTCVRKAGTVPALTTLSGYIRVRAEDLERAKVLLDGNPVYERGGTVEIRELPGS
jgi:hypothetical protein